MSTKLGELDLNLLRVFDALMQEQNLSRAAQKLHLSQPAMSNALGRLRSQLDETLFVRTPRGMQPTAHALALHGPVRQALRLLEEAFTPHGTFDPHASDHVFTLAMNDYAQAVLLPGLLSRMETSAPRVVLSVEPDTADSLVARLAAGTLDLAIDYLYFDAPELCYESLAEEPLVVVARRDHPAFRNGLTLETFQSARHVSVLPRAGRGSPLEIVLGSAKVRRHVQLFVPNYLAIPAIVAQSDLLGTVPRRLAQQFERAFPITYADLPLAMPPTQVSLIWHQQQALAPGLTWLRAQIGVAVRARA